MAGSFQPAIQFTLYNQVRRYLLLRSGALYLSLYPLLRHAVISVEGDLVV